jgi:hypothetical protein
MWTSEQRNIRLKTAEMKFTRRRAGYLNRQQKKLRDLDEFKVDTVENKLAQHVYK